MSRNRREGEFRGQLEIPHAALLSFIKKYPRFEFMLEDYRFKGKDEPAYLPVRKLNVEQLKGLRDLLEKTSPRPTGTIAQVGMHVELMEKPGGKKIGTLPQLETALRAFMKEKIIRGWLFRKREGHEKILAVLVTSIRYRPASGRGKDRSPASTNLSYTYWTKGKRDSGSVTWYADDLGKDVEALLGDQGLFRETRALIDEYLKDEAQFLDWRKRMGCQFIGKGSQEVEGERSWETKDRTMAGDRVVVDDRCDPIEARCETDLFTGIDLSEDSEDNEADHDQTDQEALAAKSDYTRIPIEPYIWCFNLETHEEGWIIMYDLQLYKYRPEVKDKLILSDEHGDLIDALTADRDVLMEDIVTGKTGGTTIILQGKAGTGKTLTAEVYVEVMKCPLYRIHSGQLGISPDTVEKVLQDAMKRANRWNCALLIDECDVFLRQRGESLEQNAIVSVFLRLLEYFNGLLFLTTNRIDAIDEAILSRAIANIKFKEPEEAERFKLWQTLGEVYQLKLLKDDKACRRLAKELVCTGRDIKGLIRLSTKYARQRKKVLTVEDIKRMAVFKGLT